MAVFAPYRPDTLDNPIVYVINFHELTNDYTFIPKNMTFDGNGIGIPNSYVQQMPLKEAKQLIEDIKNDIANMIFTTATEVFIPIQGRSIKVWPPGSEPTMGGGVKYSFEITDTIEFIKKEMFDNDIYFKKNLPTIVRPSSLEALFSTYCIYKTVDSYENFYRCDKCLWFEKDYIIPNTDSNFVLDLFPFSTDTTELLPNCNKCHKKNKWIVYCTYTIVDSGEPFERIESNTYIEQTDHEELTQDKFGIKYKDKDVCARFFRSEAAARKFYNLLINGKNFRIEQGPQRSTVYVKRKGNCEPIESLCACMFGTTYDDLDTCIDAEQYAVYCLNGQVTMKKYIPPDEEIENSDGLFFETEAEALEYYNEITGQDWGTKWICLPSGGYCYEVDEWCCDPRIVTCYDDQQTCEDNCGSGSGSETESQSFLFDPTTNTWKLK
jgi:hypothetical protein